MFGIAVELAQRQTLGPDVDIYYMTDKLSSGSCYPEELPLILLPKFSTRKELIESTSGLKFLDLGEHSCVP